MVIRLNCEGDKIYWEYFILKLTDCFRATMHDKEISTKQWQDPVDNIVAIMPPPRDRRDYYPHDGRG